MKKILLIVILFLTLSANAIAEDSLAPKIKPLPYSEIQTMFDSISTGKEIPIEKLHQALIGPQTALRADVAELLGEKGDESSIPFLIDALSDNSSYVGGGRACFGKPGQNTTRYWANESLKKLTGEDFGFVWDSSEEERQKAIERWRNWYLDKYTTN